MKIKWLSFAGLFVLLMSVATYLFATQLKIESSLLRDKETAIVMANKTWKLTFSEQVEKDTVTKKTVYIMNDKGEEVSAQITLEDDLKTLVITPPESGYDLASRFYTIHLSKDIKSIFGRSMSKKLEIKFVVKDTLPVIGSKSKLNDYFNTIIKQQEKENVFATATMESAEESADSSANKSASADVSETNIQVQGVDESDFVKTNGKYIYQVVDGKVNIIETNDGKNMKLLDPITFPSTFTPFQLFLHEDKLLVIGHSYEEMKREDVSSKVAESLIAPSESTKAIVFDVRSPKKPIEERTLSIEGHIVSSRKIDNKIYLVTNQHPQYWLMQEYEDADLRPKYSDSTVSEDKLAIDYDEIQYFPDSNEPNYILIAAFDLEKPEQEATITTYLGGGNEMYMSKENLYLAVQNWPTREMLEDKVVEPLSTNIYKFSIDDLDVRFHSSTEVEGRILNQFSMDEHEGYFRVATTKGMVWDEERPSSNNLFIYDENLKEVSSLKDLARGERIYSARFMGEKIYIVTFKETDPLFVIDASEPLNPKVLGELKIPGFSNYLHPLDENHLIGFGHDTKVVPSKDSKEPLILTEGVKLSLFDITDMKNPKEMFTEIIGGRGTYSPLNYDHKALLYHPEKKLFAFPINVYQSVKGDDFDQKFEFQGAYVYNVDLDNGFSLKKKISHMKGNEPYEEWENEISRLLYIGDKLFALSNSKISSYTMNDYQKIEEVSLRK